MLITQARCVAGISLGCTAVTITALKQMPQFTCVGLEPGESCSNYVDNPVAPAVFVALSALFVSHCFMQVFGMAITTILLSFCLDEDKFKSGKYKDKLDDQGNKDGRMFCVINNKIGLIEMCAGSVRDEHEKLMAERNEFAKQAQRLEWADCCSGTCACDSEEPSEHHRAMAASW